MNPGDQQLCGCWGRWSGFGALSGLGTFGHWKQRNSVPAHLREVGIPQGSEDPLGEAPGVPLSLSGDWGGGKSSLALGVAWAPLGAGLSAPAPLRGGGTSDEIRRSGEAPGVPLSLGPRGPSGTQVPGPLPSGAMSALPNPLYPLKEPFALQGPPSAWVDRVDV